MSAQTARFAGTLALALGITLWTPVAMAAQQPPGPAAAAAYIEVGGNGLLYTVNYEARFHDHGTARLGFMFTNRTVESEETGQDTSVGVALVPVMGNLLLGRGAGRLEIGAGPMIGIAGTGVQRVEVGGTYVEFDDLNLAGVTSSVGYRYMPRDGGPVFRATVTPFYSGALQVWGGLTLGWTF